MDGLIVIMLLNDRVVWNIGKLLNFGRRWSLPQERTKRQMPASDGVILFDGFGVQPRNEEDCGEDTQSTTNAQSD